MENDSPTANLTIRNLDPGEEAPYELLLEADPSRERIERYLKESNCRLAYKNEQLAGAYVIQLRANSDGPQPKSAEILNISIANGLQGMGLGKLLIFDAVEFARGYGVEKLDVCTESRASPNLPFIRNADFA